MPADGVASYSSPFQVGTGPCVRDDLGRALCAEVGDCGKGTRLLSGDRAKGTSGTAKRCDGEGCKCACGLEAGLEEALV